MKKLLPAAFVVFFTIVVLAPPVKAPPSQTYYELAELGYNINTDRTLSASENYIIYNPAWQTFNYTITRNISTDNTYNINVWSDTPGLRYDVNKAGGKTAITIRFSVSGRTRLTYRISYTANNLVSGSGSRYRTTLGGVILDSSDFPYQRYVVRVQGPAGTKLFLKNPYNAQLLENDPPIVQYETSVSAPGSFDGLVAHFYTQPAYYKLTLTERLINQTTTPIDDVQLNVMLFTDEASWQFSALASSNLPIKMMYVDEENNWHGVFNTGEILPGATKELQLGLIYEINVYDPEISKGEVGLLADVPSELAPYLQPDDKWESDRLAQVATSVVGRVTNAYLVGQKIVEFVVDRLDYDNQMKRREGALWAYQNRKGDCSEYTDLSISLARAVGLPARAMYGWGYKEDNQEKIGHAWAEFYLPYKGWQPVEPTWPDTLEVDIRNYLFRLDPIHLTRNVRGLSSGESGTTIVRWGEEPAYSENIGVKTLTTFGAAQEFVAAAQYAVTLSGKLLADAPNDALETKLELAKQALANAQAANDENQIIIHAKSSIQNANTVIRALGKPPTEPSPWDMIKEFFMKIAWPWLVIICALIAAGGIIWKIRSR